MARSTHSIFYGKKDFTWDDDHYLVVSCDPAIRNLAIRIEKRYKSGQIILIETEKVDLLDNSKTRYEHLYDFLDKYKSIFLETHIFIVERQVPKNFEAVKMSQHLISYFICLRHEFKKNPVIMDISSHNKGKQLACPPKCKDYWLKRWSIVRAYELFQARKDNKSIDIINQIKKKDDIADTAIQIEAAFKLLGLPLTENFDHNKVVSIQEIQRILKPVKPPKIPKPPKPQKINKRKLRTLNIDDNIKLDEQA